MIKYNENDMGCTSCMGHGRCTDWKREVSSNKISPAWCMPVGKYYANKEQVEGLISYHENKKNDIEFMVGDKVFHITQGNGEIFTVEQGRGSSVGVKFEDGSEGWFSRDGKNVFGRGSRLLFHGHNLEVIVKEKVPVRKRVRWIFLYIIDNVVITSVTFKTKTECYADMKNAQSMGYDIIKKPFDIEV